MLPFRSVEEADRVAPVVREHLRRHRILGYPTETVYGLGGAADAASLGALADLKARPPGKPFLLLVASRVMAEQAGLVFTRGADALATAFWPGPLTLVLAGGEGRLPDGLRGPEGGIAVRHTSHRVVGRLIELLREPLTSTSANLPGQPPAAGPEQLVSLFGPAYQRGELLVLDGGPLGNVPPSTIVDCTGPQARLIREGSLRRAELRRAVGRLAP